MAGIALNTIQEQARRDLTSVRLADYARLTLAQVEIFETAYSVIYPTSDTDISFVALYASTPASAKQE